MFNMPPAIFEELSTIANDTGLTVDQILQEAILHWIRFEAPTHMRNLRTMKEFSADRSVFRLIEGGPTKQLAPAPQARAWMRGYLSK